METGFSLFYVISVITSFLAVTLGTSLLFKHKLNKANIFLGLLLWVKALFFLPGMFEVLGVLDDLPHVIRLNFFSGVLVGPFTYLYCITSIHKDSVHFKKIYLHFIPFLIALVYHIPVLSKSGVEKLAIYQQVITTGKIPEPEWVIALMGVYTIFYTFLSIRMAYGYINYSKNTRSSIDLSFHRWLFFLSCSLTLPIFSTVIISVTRDSILSVNLALLILSLFIFIIYITLTLKPRFFSESYYQIRESEQNSISDTPKYQNSNLTDQMKEKYQLKIIRHMEEEKPYRDPELTISDFSEQTKIPSYYVSQIINEKLESHFLDFVNRYRIEEVKSKLKDSSQNHFTIITIAYDCGFNSKTAFYSAFRKNVGTTPSIYRKENQSVPA